MSSAKRSVEAWPTGTVTFLMTDVVGSSSLAEADPARYLELLARHDALAREAVSREGGVLVKHRGEGDSIFAAFGSAEAGARAAQSLVAGAWRDLGLELRAALHCGAATLAEGDYRGDAVNRCGRLRGLAAPRQVLLSGSVAALLAPVSAQPLGSVRLRGLVRPVELFVLAGDGLVQEGSPSGVRRGNLVAPMGRLYGREEELAALGRAFERWRLVELVGPGGVGKTRLATEFGTGVAGRFPGGVWFVDLTRTEAAPIEPTVLNELGLSAPGERDAAAVVGQELGGEGEALLILDNCEHVAGAAAGFVRRLAALAPSLRVLATTLEHLPVSGTSGMAGSGVATVKVGPLSSGAAAAAMLRDVAEAKAIPVVGSDAEVAGLCRDLDGLPLAIELAVPRLRTLSVAGVRARLGGWLGRGGAGEGVGERQSSLGALVAYSLGRLSAEERDLLESLARFAGGFTLAHAEAVCARDAEEVEERLGGLLERSMVSPDEQGGVGGDEGGEPRFRLLSAVRAGVRAGTADPAARGAAFVAWAVGWAQAGVAAGPPFGTIRGEVANLEAAFDDALELGDAMSAAVIARGLGKVYLETFDTRAGLRLYIALESRFGELDEASRGIALTTLGAFQLARRAFGAAGSALREALALYEAAGEEERSLVVRVNLAIAYDGEGDPAACAREAGLAMAGFEALGRSRYAAAARLSHALGLWRSGDEGGAAAAIAGLASGSHEEDRLLLDAFLSAVAVELAAAERDGEARTAILRMDGTCKDGENEVAPALLAAADLLHKAGEGALVLRCAGVYEAVMAAKGLPPTPSCETILSRLRRAGRAPSREDKGEVVALWPLVREKLAHEPGGMG